MTDGQKAMVAVKEELALAQQKFPPMRSFHEGYAILQEEVDELWTEVKASKPDSDTARMRAEAIQVAAMALRFVIDLT
jgi:hypothetical protein